MATPEEKRILHPPLSGPDGEPPPAPDNGRRRTISMNLNTLVVARLSEAYVDEGLLVPRDFLKEGYLLPTTGVASHCDSQLKKRRRVPDPSTFAEWRKQYTEGSRGA